MRFFTYMFIFILAISSASAYIFNPLRNDIWGDTITPNQGNNAVEITNYNSSGFNSILISCSGASCSDDGFNSTGGLLQRDNSSYALTSQSRMKRYFNDGISRAYIYMSATSSPWYCSFNTILNGWTCTNAGITTSNYRGGDFLQYITGVNNYNLFVYTQTNSFIAEYDTFTQAFTFPATQLAGITCQNINPDSTAIIRTMNTLGNPQNGRLDQTFTNSYAIGSIPSGNGRAGCKIYSAQDGGIGWWTGDATHQAQLFKLNNLANFSQTTEYNTLSTNCANIFALPQMNIYGVDCKNDNECVAVGAYGNNANAMAFGFNKTDCNYLYPINTEYNASYLMDAAYEPISNKYFIVGKNALFTIQSPMVANAGSNGTVNISINNSRYVSTFYIDVNISQNPYLQNIDGTQITASTIAKNSGYSGVLEAFDIINGVLQEPIAYFNTLIFITNPVATLINGQTFSQSASQLINAYGRQVVNPLVKDVSIVPSPSINYRILSPYHSGAYSYNCQFSELPKFLESFNYTDSITNHNWTSACGMASTFTSANYPTLLLSNSTCVSTITYQLPSAISSNTEKYRFHYFVKPLGENYSSGLTALINQSIFIDILDNNANDMIPLIYNYTEDDGHSNPRLCIYNYPQSSQNTVLIGCLPTTEGIIADIYIDLQDGKYDARFTTADAYNANVETLQNNGKLLYTQNLRIYNPSGNNLRRIYINPFTQSASLIGDMSLTSFNTSGFSVYDDSATIGATGTNTILDIKPITCTYPTDGSYNLAVFNSNESGYYASNNIFGSIVTINAQSGLNVTNQTGNQSNIYLSCLNDPSQAICSSSAFCNQFPTFQTCLQQNTSTSQTNFRLWIAIIAIIISVTVGVVVLAHEGISPSIMSAFVAIVTVFEIIGFTIAGYIPTWVTLITALIAGAILYLSIRKFAIGSHMEG